VQEFAEAATQSGETSNQEIQKSVHRTIKKVTEDLDGQRYNTAIAAMMQCVNELYKAKAGHGFADATVWRFALESLVQLIAPFAPHIAEELWQDLGHDTTIHIDHWPKYDEQYLVSDTMTIVVQINGKVRSQLDVPSDMGEDQIVIAAQADEKVAAHLAGKDIRKTVYVAKKLVSFVV
jgi:leucyl-tRNA synthetase